MKALGLIALVVLILVGALMPLKYTARLNLPTKVKGPGNETTDAAQDHRADDHGR